jgi:hypothetical protein
MKRFYLILAALAVAGAAVLVLASRERPMPGAIEGAVPVVATDGFTGFTLGSDSASVEIVEYSDFECPFCARFANLQMPAVRRQLIETGLVRWRFRDYPLPNHQFSRLAAHAAQCAGEQGRFWEMHDALYANHLPGRRPAGTPRGCSTSGPSNPGSRWGPTGRAWKATGTRLASRPPVRRARRAASAARRRSS